MSCKISEFLNFHASHLNHETFKLCLQNILNMSKTTRVYFGVLQISSAEAYSLFKNFVYLPVGNFIVPNCLRMISQAHNVFDICMFYTCYIR